MDNSASLWDAYATAFNKPEIKIAAPLEEEGCENCQRLKLLTHTSLDGKRRICRDCFTDTDGNIKERLSPEDRVETAISKLLRGINPKLL